MGPENGKAEDLVLYTKDGERLGPIRDLPEVTVTPGEEAAQAFRRVMRKMSATIDVKPPKHWSCRSRKRFIKLMMGEGWTRNWAEALAHLVRGSKIPYSEAWKSHLRTGFERKAYEHWPY